jgi:prepilin-type N-terminal cleavage/methylation domain-containing protein
MMKKGFTLVELLVVIAIIAILAGGVVVMINPVEKLKESRDSRRIQDIQSIKQAVDLALADGQITLNGTPVALATGNSKEDNSVISADGATSWVKVSTATGQTGLGKYIPILPSDPQQANAPGFGYEWVSDGESYEIKTSFESAKYIADYPTKDGGNEVDRYEVGTKVGFGF